MAAVTICSDFGAPKIKVSHCFHCFPIYLPWSDGTRCHDLSGLSLQQFEAGFSSQPEIEVGSWPWEHWILATRPVVSQWWPCLFSFAEKELPQRWKVVKQANYFVGVKSIQYVWIDTQAGSERVAESRAHWQFELLSRGISSGFPLTSHFDLPGSESIFGVSQDPPTCVHASLSQDGFHLRGL